MSQEEMIDTIGAEYEIPNGSLYKLRQGEYDQEGLERLLAKLRMIHLTGDMIRRDLVSVLWYLPLFISYQRERVEENGYDMKFFDRMEVEVTNLLEEILGTA
ncbi:MAG: hypothetical protein JWQ98_1052 [Chlorobi bacterium]|nr:hypothetical protein [Chlorobiota bacterium]